jgi:hypothetical protein
MPKSTSATVSSCGETTSKVTLAAAVLTTDQSDTTAFTVGLAGVTVKLLKGDTVVETQTTGGSGAVTFDTQVKRTELGSYKVKVRITDEQSQKYTFLDPPEQKKTKDGEKRGFLKSDVPAVHTITFKLDWEHWIGIILKEEGSATRLTRGRVKLKFADNTTRIVRLAELTPEGDGSFKIVDIPDGECKISFPDFFSAEWKSV